MFGFGYHHPRSSSAAAEYHVFRRARAIRVPEDIPALLAAGGVYLRTVMHGHEQIGRISPKRCSCKAPARDSSRPRWPATAARRLADGAPVARLTVAKEFGVDGTLDPRS